MKIHHHTTWVLHHYTCGKFKNSHNDGGKEYYPYYYSTPKSKKKLWMSYWFVKKQDVKINKPKRSIRTSSLL